MPGHFAEVDAIPSRGPLLGLFGLSPFDKERHQPRVTVRSPGLRFVKAENLALATRLQQRLRESTG